MDCNLPDSSVHGILQARTLEWVVMPSSRAPSRPRVRTHVSYSSCASGRFFTAEPPRSPYDLMLLLSRFSRVRHFVTQWTIVHQAPLSMDFSRQEHWSGLPFPLLGDLPSSGIEPTPPASAGRFFTTEPPGKPRKCYWEEIFFLTNLG